MSGFISNAFRLVGRTIQQAGPFYAHPAPGTNNQIIPANGSKFWSFNLFRSYFKKFRANEGKRIKTHGWRERLKTKNGRRILMRRILKGRYYLAH